MCLENFTNIVYNRIRKWKPCIGVMDMRKLNSAQDVLDKYWDKSLPVDVKNICKKEDIIVQPTDLTELENSMNRKISGLIYAGEDGKIIFVNNNDIPARQFFTIAHELGHYYLHSGDFKDNKQAIISFRGERSKRETEADRFAADLIMPKQRVSEEYDSIPYPTITYLSRLFGVSAAAMRYRLDEMGLNYIG